MRAFTFKASARLVLLAALVTAAAAALLFISPARHGAPLVAVTAATPSSGIIAPPGPPVLPFTGTWTGTASGTGANANESNCMEGINCDTFRLTVAPGDYTGKVVKLRIEWSVVANDYDIYVHKCPTEVSTNDQCNATPPTGQATSPSPDSGGQENTAIDPSNTGLGAYTVRVVYSTVTPQVDQYRGTASIAAKSESRSAT